MKGKKGTSNRQKGFGMVSEPRGKFGDITDQSPTIPGKPPRVGPNKTHGSYSNGTPVGTRIHK